MRRLLTPAVLLFLTLPLASCGGKSGLHPVQGRVLYKGAPAAGALVVFHPAADKSLGATRPYGLTDADGQFTLKSDPKNDGAPAGSYHVRVSWPSSPPKGEGKTVSLGEDERAGPGDQLQGRYNDPARPQLTAEVRAGANRLEPFDLK